MEKSVPFFDVIFKFFIFTGQWGGLSFYQCDVQSEEKVKDLVTLLDQEGPSLILWDLWLVESESTDNGKWLCYEFLEKNQEVFLRLFLRKTPPFTFSYSYPFNKWKNFPLLSAQVQSQLGLSWKSSIFPQYFTQGDIFAGPLRDKSNQIFFEFYQDNFSKNTFKGKNFWGEEFSIKSLFFKNKVVSPQFFYVGRSLQYNQTKENSAIKSHEHYNDMEEEANLIMSLLIVEVIEQHREYASTKAPSELIASLREIILNLSLIYIDLTEIQLASYGSLGKAQFKRPALKKEIFKMFCLVRDFKQMELSGRSQENKKLGPKWPQLMIRRLEQVKKRWNSLKLSLNDFLKSEKDSDFIDRFAQSNEVSDLQRFDIWRWGNTGHFLEIFGGDLKQKANGDEDYQKLFSVNFLKNIFYSKFSFIEICLIRCEEILKGLPLVSSQSSAAQKRPHIFNHFQLKQENLRIESSLIHTSANTILVHLFLKEGHKHPQLEKIVLRTSTLSQLSFFVSTFEGIDKKDFQHLLPFFFPIQEVHSNV